MLVALLNAAPSDIRLVGDDERGSNDADRHTVALVVVADRADDLGDVLGGHIHVVQDLKSHQRAGLAVVRPVNDISDVVQPGRCECQVNKMRIIFQRLQNVSGPHSHDADMGIGMFCVM